jgi:hypothetical protein
LQQLWFGKIIFQNDGVKKVKKGVKAPSKNEIFEGIKTRFVIFGDEFVIFIK